MAPDHPSVLDTAGWIYYLQGELSKAEPSLLRAVRLDPFDPQIQYHLGLLLLKQGRQAEAREALERSLRSSRIFSEAADARSELQSIK